MKILIAVAQSGFMYLSDCYGGRRSDRYICRDSEVYSHLSNKDEVLADRRFQITENLLYYNGTLIVLNASVLKKLQILGYTLRELKKIIKGFRILKNTLPINFFFSQLALNAPLWPLPEHATLLSREPDKLHQPNFLQPISQCQLPMMLVAFLFSSNPQPFPQ